MDAQNLQGSDVILIHRLMKNSISKDLGPDRIWFADRISRPGDEC